MLWWKFGWRNLWRNKLRTSIQLIAIAGGICLVTFFANLQKGAWDKVVNDGVASGSGHVALYHPHYLLERKIEQFFPIPGLLDKLAKIPSVTAVYPRLYIPGLARSSHESRAALVLGIDIEREKLKNPILDSKRIFKGELPLGAKRDLAFIGKKLAANLQVDVGNKIVLMFQDINGKIASKLFRISGIFRSGVPQMDGSFIFVDREVLAEAVGKPNIAHEVAMIAGNPNLMSEILAGVSTPEILPNGAKAFPWQEAMPELAGAVKMDYFQLMIFLAMIYSVVGIGAINTLLMSVMERTREFGLFRAIGLNSSQIRNIIFFEAACLALAGIALGLFLSFWLSLYTWSHGLDFTKMMGDMEVAGILIDPVVHSGWDFKSALFMASLMVILVLLGSIYPAHRALKIRPAEAMRKF